MASIISKSAARDPRHVALKLDGLELSYAQLDEATMRLAGSLGRRGVASGDRVGIMLPNLPYFAVC